LGDCFLWSGFWKLKKQRKFLGYSFPREEVFTNFDKIGLGYTLGEFSLTHLVTLTRWLMDNVTIWRKS
jgi:hypothetical protein